MVDGFGVGSRLTTLEAVELALPEERRNNVAVYMHAFACKASAIERAAAGCATRGHHSKEQTSGVANYRQALSLLLH